MQNMQHNMQSNMQNMQNYMQNMQLFQICTLWSPIFRICKIICTICKICKAKILYAKYALPMLLMISGGWLLSPDSSFHFLCKWNSLMCPAGRFQLFLHFSDDLCRRQELHHQCSLYFWSFLQWTCPIFQTGDVTDFKTK